MLQAIATEEMDEEAAEEADEEAAEEANEDPRESTQNGYFLRSSQEIAQAAEEVKNNHLYFFSVLFIKPFLFP